MKLILVLAAALCTLSGAQARSVSGGRPFTVKPSSVIGYADLISASGPVELGSGVYIDDYSSARAVQADCMVGQKVETAERRGFYRILIYKKMYRDGSVDVELFGVATGITTHQELAQAQMNPEYQGEGQVFEYLCRSNYIQSMTVGGSIWLGERYALPAPPKEDLIAFGEVLNTDDFEKFQKELLDTRGYLRSLGRRAAKWAVLNDSRSRAEIGLPPQMDGLHDVSFLKPYVDGLIAGQQSKIPQAVETRGYSSVPN